MKNNEQKERQKLAEKAFINLLGLEKIEEIKDNNWIDFDCSFIEISEEEYAYVDYQFQIEFLERDNKGDMVIHCTLCFNDKTKKWWSENCIDYPYIEYNTFEEMISHLYDIEDEIIDNGFNLIEI